MKSVSKNFLISNIQNNIIFYLWTRVEHHFWQCHAVTLIKNLALHAMLMFWIGYPSDFMTCSSGCDTVYRKPSATVQPRSLSLRYPHPVECETRLLALTKRIASHETKLMRIHHFHIDHNAPSLPPPPPKTNKFAEPVLSISPRYYSRPKRNRRQ